MAISRQMRIIEAINEGGEEMMDKQQIEAPEVGQSLMLRTIQP
jgi:hypothetical protein